MAAWAISTAGGSAAADLRPPGRLAGTIAILWPSILVSAVGGGVIFGIAAFQFESIPATEIVLFAAAAAIVGVVPGAIAMSCFAGAAVANRPPHARSRWLTSVHAACGPLTIAAVATWITGFLAAAMLAVGSEPPAPGPVAAAALAFLLFLALSRALNRVLRRAAVAGRWHARGLCGQCGYNVANLPRCPECGVASPAARRPVPRAAP